MRFGRGDTVGPGPHPAAGVNTGPEDMLSGIRSDISDVTAGALRQAVLRALHLILITIIRAGTLHPF